MILYYIEFCRYGFVWSLLYYCVLFIIGFCNFDIV